MVRIIDCGAGENPDPRATATVDVNSEADYTFDLDADWPFEANSVDGIIMNHVLEHLDPIHAISEVDRVLKPGGFFEITVPIGISQRSDPTHTWFPTYESLAILSNDFGPERPWDTKTGLELVSRDVTAKFLPPLSPLNPVLSALAHTHPKQTTELAQTGEMTARYKKQ